SVMLREVNVKLRADFGGKLGAEDELTVEDSVAAEDRAHTAAIIEVMATRSAGRSVGEQVDGDRNCGIHSAEVRLDDGVGVDTDVPCAVADVRVGKGKVRTHQAC